MLDAERLDTLYVLHGDAPLLIAEAGDNIRARARAQGFDDREILISGPGFKWESLRQAAGNLSLFGGGKLIDLRIPNGKPGREGGDALQNFANNQTQRQGTLTLITLPALDWATRKTAWFKTLETHANVQELNEPSREALPAWIAQRLAQQNQSAEPEALQFITDRVEGNLLAAHQEIQKLALLHPPGELKLAQIKEAVLDVARYDIDDLRQAILQADVARCIRLLEGLQGEGAAPPLLLWMLSNEIRVLLNIQRAQKNGAPLANALKAERIFDANRRASISRALERLNVNQLTQALLLAARIDRIIKGIAPGDVWSELSILCLRLARTPQRR